jgi:hypothetical protein
LMMRLTPPVDLSWTSRQEHDCRWPVYCRETFGYLLRFKQKLGH